MTALRDRAIDTAAAWAENAVDFGDLSWPAIAEGIITTYETALNDQAPALVLEHERAAIIEAAGYTLAMRGLRDDMRPPLTSILERLREPSE